MWMVNSEAIGRDEWGEGWSRMRILLITRTRHVRARERLSLGLVNYVRIRGVVESIFLSQWNDTLVYERRRSFPVTSFQWIQIPQLPEMPRLVP